MASGVVKTLFKGTPVLTAESFGVLRQGKEEHLVALYLQTNDPIQMILIELLCEAKGYKLPVIEDEPPQAAI